LKQKVNSGASAVTDEYRPKSVSIFHVFGFHTNDIPFKERRYECIIVMLCNYWEFCDWVEGTSST